MCVLRGHIPCEILWIWGQKVSSSTREHGSPHHTMEVHCSIQGSLPAELGFTMEGQQIVLGLWIGC